MWFLMPAKEMYHTHSKKSKLRISQEGEWYFLIHTEKFPLLSNKQYVFQCLIFEIIYEKLWWWNRRWKRYYKLVQRCLNRSIAQRTISKQEAMCELARLPSVICSEIIETVSLSGYIKLSNGCFNESRTMLNKYKNRKTNLNQSLHQFFHSTKKRL